MGPGVRLRAFPSGLRDLERSGRRPGGPPKGCWLVSRTTRPVPGCRRAPGGVRGRGRRFPPAARRRSPKQGVCTRSGLPCSPETVQGASVCVWQYGLPLPLTRENRAEADGVLASVEQDRAVRVEASDELPRLHPASTVEEDGPGDREHGTTVDERRSDRAQEVPARPLERRRASTRRPRESPSLPCAGASELPDRFCTWNRLPRAKADAEFRDAAEVPPVAAGNRPAAMCQPAVSFDRRRGHACDCGNLRAATPRPARCPRTDVSAPPASWLRSGQTRAPASTSTRCDPSRRSQRAPATASPRPPSSSPR